MTDTDVKERGPLSRVWPGISLLLCYFHLSQCWKNDIHKRLGRGGDNATIQQRQILKAYLRSVLKEVWSIDGDEQLVREFIIMKKRSLEGLVARAENLTEEVRKVLSGGVEFLSYLEKQWAGDLLYSWSLNGRKKAARALQIPIEKLPTTNNHLEGTNEYLKNNQLKRFQRGGRPLRADVLYVALVSEIIPNILTLRSLAADLEKEKAERRREFNISDAATLEILAREFPQVAYLAPSPNRDESARRLLHMKKVVGYEVERATGKLLVRVESETMPGLTYMTCVHGKATDICCQCHDFLQTGIMCKHLRAAALYIDELRKQEGNRHLPEMVFKTRHEAQIIRRSLGIMTEAVQEDGTEGDDDDENEITDEVNDNNNDNDNEDDGSIPFSSEEALGHIEHALNLTNVSVTVAASMENRADTPAFVHPSISTISLNSAAVRKQELDVFLASTERCLQTLRENSAFFQDPSIEEQPSAGISNECVLATYLRAIVTSDSFQHAQNLIDVISERKNPRKHQVDTTGILPLERESKQRRHSSYSSL